MRLTWKRWSNWAAHLYDGDEPTCPFPGSSTRHGRARYLRPGVLRVLEGDDLTPHGVPYGKVCPSCTKRFQRLRREAPSG